MSYRRNVGVIIGIESVWAVGASFVTFDIVSALIYTLHGTAMLIAAISIISAVLVNAPQILVPYFKQKLRHPIGGSALGQGLIVAGFAAVAAALMVTKSETILLAIVVATIVIGGLGNALNYPFYQELRMRLFPPRTRTASYSTVLFFSQLGSAAGALLCIAVLNRGGGPSSQRYLWCFAIASVLATVSTIGYGFLRDPDPAPPPAAGVRPLAEFLRDYGKILRGDRNLRVFLISEWFNWVSAMGSIFITYYGVTLFGPGIAAVCSFSRFLGAILTVPVAHAVVSRLGPRKSAVTFYLCLIVMYVVLVMPTVKATIILATFLTGSAQMFRNNYMFHLVGALSPDADKTRYYSLSNGAVSPMMVVGPLLGGVLVQALGNYRLVFALCIPPLAVAGWLVAKVMKDPPGPEPTVGGVSRVMLKRMAG